MGATVPLDARRALAVILMNRDLLELLRCARCGATRSSSGAALVCSRCSAVAPIVDNIPRFVDQPSDVTARRTQSSFGYEWTHFKDWTVSGEVNFEDYFQGLDLHSLSGRTVLDAGCGMGRHARQIAPFAGRVIAVDFSRAIDQAARNSEDRTNVDCVQADLLSLPLADGAFDFVYSLGVLHHLGDTERALREIVRKLRPAGRLRIYLYWKRHGWQGQLLKIVSAARRITTRLPFPVLRGTCLVLGVGLFGGVILPYRALSAAGVRRHANWPLFVYTKYPFGVLYNDQFDRFSAPIEKRYDPDDVRRLLVSVGLQDITVRPCFGWLADGVKPA